MVAPINENPESSWFLEGVPLNINRIRAEVRRELRLLRASLTYQQSVWNILRQATEMRRGLMQKIEDDVGKFLVLNDRGKKDLMSSVSTIIDQCMSEELLDSEMISTYLYKENNDLETINTLNFLREKKSKEVVFVSKNSLISDLLSFVYDDTKCFIVTEAGDIDKRIVGILKKSSLNFHDLLEKVWDVSSLIGLSWPMTPEDADRFIEQHSLDYFPVVNEAGEVIMILTKEEVRLIIQKRTGQQVTILDAQRKLEGIINEERLMKKPQKKQKQEQS